MLGADGKVQKQIYAGDRVSMKVERMPGASGANQDNVRFSVVREGGQPLSVGLHSNVLGLPNAQVSAKRVTSIDQFTRNAKGERVGVESTASPQVLPTRASLQGMVWERVDVLSRGGKSDAMSGSSFTQLFGRDAGNRVNEKATFHLGGFTAAGGERLDITPTPTH